VIAAAAVAAALTITVWPEGTAGPSHTWTLHCAPTRGTLPGRVIACEALSGIRKPFAPVPPGTVCAQVYGGPQVALVRGTYRGKRVWTFFRRRDSCETERWRRVKFLFP
jgi:hypothetical protein